MDIINTSVDNSLELYIIENENKIPLDMKEMKPNQVGYNMDINSRDLIYENRFYKFQLKCNIPYQSLSLIIDNDVKFEDTSYKEGISIEIPLKNYFAGLYDLTRVTVGIVDQHNNCLFYQSEYFKISTTKANVEVIEKIIDEVFDYDKNLLECIFSSNYRNILAGNKKFINVNTLKQMLEEFCEILKKNYNFFRTKAKVVVLNKREILDTNSISRIDTQSVQSIFQNLDDVQQVSYISDILINDKYYIPRKIKGIKKEVSHKVYENEIIIGFINELNKYVQNLYKEVEEKFLLLDIQIKGNSIYKEGEIVPNEMLERLTMKKYQHLMKEIEVLKKEYRKIYHLYSTLFKINNTNLLYKPKYTDTFRSIRHYRDIFNIILKFFEYKDYEFNELGYMLGFKSLHAIYEYYCLIKLLQSWKKLGYQIIDAKKYDKYEKSIYDDKDEVSKSINNTYYLEKPNDSTVTIYYQPKISAQKLLSTNGISLIRRDGEAYYEPDYLIKYSRDDKNFYSILDAKFSNIGNVKKHYLQNLIYKYLMNIGDRDTKYSTVVNLSALCVSGNNNYTLSSSHTMHCIPKVNILVFSPYKSDEQMYESCKEILNIFRQVE